MSNVPDISSFHYDKSVNGIIESSINMYRGAVCFDYNLVCLPQHEQVGITLKASYNGDLDKRKTIPNTISPTGVMGFGWNLTYEKIECSRSDIGKNPENRNYYITTGDSSGSGEILHLMYIKDGILYFENEVYSYTETLYDPCSETWIITDQNGIKYIYGGENEYFEYAVLSDGKYTAFPCTEASSLSSAIKSWNLREVISPYSNCVKYEYEYDKKQLFLNSPYYTKACYIKRISDSFGNCAELIYKDKLCLDDPDKDFEYADPYNEPVNSQFNFHQSEYETKYLSSINVSNEYETLYRIELTYCIANFDTSDTADGSTAKRMLKSICMVSSENRMPAMKFEYCGTSEINAGSLKSVLYPEGGKVSYCYTQNHTIAMTERSEVISNSGFSEKAKIVFGSDYAVVVQKNTGKVEALIYRWIGRWQKYTPDIDLNGIDPQMLQINAHDMYAVIAGTSFSGDTSKCVILTKSRTIKGGWYATELVENAMSDTDIISGDKWFFVHNKDEDELIYYYCDQLNEKWVRGDFTDSAGSDDYSRKFICCQDQLLCFEYDIYGCGEKNYIKIYESTYQNEWKLILNKEVSDIYVQGGSDGEFFINFDGHFAAGAFITDKTEMNLTYSLIVWRINAQCELIQEFTEKFSLNIDDPAYIIPQISGNTIMSAGNLYRYCGNEWSSCRGIGIYSKGQYQFAFSDDIALVSYINDKNEVDINGAVFNPQLNLWETKQLFRRNAEYPSFGVSISGNIAVCGSRVYDIHDMTFNNLIEEFPPNYGTINLYNNGKCIVSSVYEKKGTAIEAYQSFIHTYRNGKIESKITENRVFGENCGGSYDIFCLGNMSDDAELLYSAGGNPKEEITFFQASKVQINDGTDKITKHYTYDTNYASCDENGQYAHYSAVTVANECSQNSKSVYRYYDSVSQFSKSENVTSLSVTDGTLISINSYLNGKLNNSFTADYEFTNIVDGRKIYSNTLAGGKLTQISEINDDNAGAEKVTEFKVDVLSGQRTEVTTYNYNLKGEIEKHTDKSVPAYTDIRYADQMKKLHKFTDMWEQSTTVNGELASYKETKYDIIDSYLSEKSVKLNAPDGCESKTVYNIKNRGKYANIISKDGMFPEYFIYDKRDFCRIASFTNSGFGECFAYTFEDYEIKPDQTFKNALITDSKCYAGKKSVQIKPDGFYKIRHTFIPERTDYGFSFYSKCTKDGMLKIKCGQKSIENVIKAGDFSYNLIALKSLDIQKNIQTEIEFTFCNNSDQSLYIDILAFFSLLNPPQISVYKKGGALLGASLSGYGSICEPIYDKFNRSVCVVGNKKIIECSIPSFARENGSRVNSNLCVKNAGNGIYLKNIQPDTAFIPEIKLDKNYFVNFMNNSDFEVNINGTIKIKLENKKLLLNDSVDSIYKEIFIEDPTCKFVTVIISDIILLAFDGQIVCSYKKICRNDSSFEIIGKQEISEFVIGNEPNVKMIYSDGCGKVRQTHTLCNDKVSVTAKAYDAYGRNTVLTIPTYIEENFLEYIDNYIEKIDDSTNQMYGRVCELNTQCKSYPYSINVYEDRADGRVIEKGLPCPEFAINNNIDKSQRHTVRMSYSAVLPECNELKKLISHSTSEKPHYISVKTLDPDNNEMVNVFNLRKEKIADIVKLNDKQLCTLYSSEFKDSLLQKTVIMPDGNSNVSKYNFKGELIYSNDVNSGEKKFFYDNCHNLRFEKDGECTKEGLCKYRLYDQVYRLIEEGLFKTSLSDEELNKKADEPSYPYEEKIISKKYYYDGDFGINDIGKLTRIETFDETTANLILFTTVLKSDNKENTVSKTVSFGDESFTTINVYDNFGNLIKKKSADGTSIEYLYDTCLRNNAVLSEGDIITQTEFCANGLPKKVLTCETEIQYSYDGRDKVTGIKSPFYSEKITYLENGRYYNGKISSLETTIKSDVKTENPLSLNYCLDYDENGRLVSARCKQADELSLKDIKYDNNGNILSFKENGQSKDFTLEKNSDKLEKTSSSEYKYNKNGTVSSIKKDKDKNIKINYYKYSGLPKQFITDDSVVDILYDESGKRLKKTVCKNGKTESSKVYFYDGVRVSEEIRNSKHINYFYGVSGINAVLYDKKKISVITDRLGYTRVVAESNAIIQAYHYKPFGEALKVIEKSQLVNMLFGNYELDSETELYYALSRMYDPEAFRFLSPDPKGQFTSPYIFCGNDPFAIIDVNGETSWIASLIGCVVGIVLTVALCALTMGSSAPLSVALLGSEASAISEIAYTAAMTTIVSAVSGFASQGVKCLIDNESFTASSAYEILLSSALTGLVFGGAGTIMSKVGKLAVKGIQAEVKALKYLGQGAVLGLVNSGVQSAASPLNDVINGEQVSGINALVSAGFGALSGFITVAAGAVAGKVFPELENDSASKNIKREILNDSIWAGLDPGVWYGAITEAVDSGSTDEIYDNYSVGRKSYICSDKKKSPIDLNNSQIIGSYSRFSDSYSENINAPRYFSTRGYGQKMV